MREWDAPAIGPDASGARRFRRPLRSGSSARPVGAAEQDKGACVDTPVLQIAIKFGLGAATLYVLLLAVAWVGQRYLVYAPDPTRVAPARVGLPDVVERRLPVGEGMAVIAWHGRAKPGRPTLLYFHGNGANLAARAERIRYFLDRGFGVYMMSYRGYSGSDGRPSEAANVADARHAYLDLVAGGTRPEDIFLYGELMGTSVATRLAADTKVGGLVLDAPFTSITDIGARLYPWLPVRVLLTQRYETMRDIGKVRVPLLIVHGEADEVVPIGMGRQVFEAAAAAESRRFVAIPGAGHTDHADFGSLEIVAAFIESLPKRADPSGGKLD